MKKQGIVVKWDSEKSFGFIRSIDTPTDIFFHRRDYSENRSLVRGWPLPSRKLKIAGRAM